MEIAFIFEKNNPFYEEDQVVAGCQRPRRCRLARASTAPGFRELLLMKNSWCRQIEANVLPCLFRAAFGSNINKQLISAIELKFAKKASKIIVILWLLSGCCVILRLLTILFTLFI